MAVKHQESPCDWQCHKGGQWLGSLELVTVKVVGQTTVATAVGDGNKMARNAASFGGNDDDRHQIGAIKDAGELSL